MNEQIVPAASDVSFYYIPQIETALKDKDLDNAERLLQDARQLVAPGSPELARLQVLRNDAQKQRQAKVTELEDAIRKALAVEPMDVATAEEKLDELERFQPEHPSLAGWRGSLASERTRRRADVKCKEVETELKRLWAEAEKAEQTGLYGQALLALYLNAREYARREAANLKDPRLAGLAQRAEDTHNRVRRAHRETTTRQQEGQYKDLLEQLRQMAPTDRVTISRDLVDLEGSRDYLLASEAMRLIEAQAGDYAAKKAAGYRESALRSLEEHAPTTAEQNLSKALALFGLDAEEQQKTNDLLRDRVMPAVERRSLAENKLKQADNQDAVRAWHLFTEARIADPYTPALAEQREALLKRVIPYLNARIAEAKSYLAKTGRPEWAKAQAVAKAARELAEQDTAFQAQMEAADTILTEAEGWRQLEADIKAAIAEANAKRDQNPTGAYDGLLARRQGWGENADRFAELSEILAQLEARVRATEQLARFGDKVKSGSIDDVAQALKECMQAAGVEGPRRTDLEKMAGRLRMHLSYLRGATLLRKSDRSVEDERGGLELLREPIDGAGDDAEAARQLASTVKEDRAREEQAAAALKQGVAQLQAGQYADAYRVLKSYSGRREVADAFLKATQGWEQQLTGQIKAALTGAERVDEKALKQWVTDLEALGSTYVTELKPQVYGRCAAQRARQLMLMPQRAGLAGEVMRAWDEAVQEDPNNPDYQHARMSYDKQRTNLSLPQKPPLEQIQMLEDLAEKYPTDLDAKLWLADALIKHLATLKAYEEVESQARQARGVIAQAQQLAQISDQLSRYQEVLADKSHTVAMHLDIALRRAEIEWQLQADRLPDVWRKAREQATGLLRDYPTQRELSLWWRRVSQAALAGAQERLAARANTGDIWEKIHPAGQIVILDPDNVTALLLLGQVNQAIVRLDNRQMILEGEKTDASYAGDSAKAVETQLTEANDIQRKLNLAEQTLMNFGGLFQESDKLREQVKAIRARNEQTLERVQRLNQVIEAQALELRSQALELLRRVESQTDPVEAWDLFSKVRIADPYAPALTEVHASLVGRINRHLSSGLAAAQKCMAGSGRPEWRRAQDIAKNMRELASRDIIFQPHLEVADAILAEAADWRQLEAEINAAIAEATSRRASDPRFAYDSLLARKAGWGEKASRFPELDAFLQSLEARLTWNERIALARSLITDAKDKETLVKATNALQDALRLEPNAGEAQLLLNQAEARVRWLDQVSELKTRAKLALQVSNLDAALDSLQQLRALDPSDAEVTTLLEQTRQQMANRSIEEELPSQNQANQRSTWNLTTVLALVCLGAGILVAILASLSRAPTGLLIAMALVLAGAALYLISLLRSATA